MYRRSNLTSNRKDSRKPPVLSDFVQFPVWSIAFEKPLLRKTRTSRQEWFSASIWGSLWVPIFPQKSS